MSMKAAEVGYLLPFAIDMLGSFGGVARFGSAILHAGKSLETFLKEMRDHVCVVPPASIRNMVSSVAIHMLACQLTGIAFTPKHHQLTHLVDRIPHFIFIITIIIIIIIIAML